MVHRLAHGGAAENDGLGQQQIGARIEIDVNRAPQADLIEDNRFLRQPRELAALADVELHDNLGVRRQRPIDFFRGGGGHGQTGPGTDFDIDIETVAARHAARRVDNDGAEIARHFMVWEAHAQRPGLVHPPAPRRTVNGVDGQRNASDRAIAGKNFLR